MLNNISDVIIAAIECERLERGKVLAVKRGKDPDQAKPISVRAMSRLLGLRQQTLDRIVKRQQGIGGQSFATIMYHRPEWWDLLNGRKGNQG